MIQSQFLHARKWKKTRINGRSNMQWPMILLMKMETFYIATAKEVLTMIISQLWKCSWMYGI